MRQLDCASPMIPQLRHDFSYAVAHAKIPLAVCVLICLAQLIRLLLGVDMCDESYYFTEALRLTQGDLLLKDIWDSVQTLGIITAPLVWVYRLIFGTDGLILFFRLLFYALCLVTAAWIYFVLREQVGRKHASAIAMLIIVFAPFSLYTMGYNNLAYLFCTLGCMLYWGGLQAFSAENKARGRRRLLAAGVVHAAMIAAYPTQLILVPCVLLVFYFIARKKNKRDALKAIGWYVLGLAIVAIGMLAYILFVSGIDALYNVYMQVTNTPFLGTSMSSTTQVQILRVIFKNLMATYKQNRWLTTVIVMGISLPVGCVLNALEKKWTAKGNAIALGAFFILSIVARIIRGSLLPIYLAIGVLLVMLLPRWRSWMTITAHLIWTVFVFFVFAPMASTLTVIELAFYLALPMPGLLLTLLCTKKKSLDAFWLICVPSLLQTVVVSLSSGGAFRQGRYALIGVVLWNAVALSQIAKEANTADFLVARRQPDAEDPEKSITKADKARAIRLRVAPLLTYIITLAMTVCFLQGEYNCVFGDVAIAQYTMPIRSGPGAGLFTTADRAELLDTLAQDVRDTEGERLLCLEIFPYGYGLDASKKAFTPSTWVCSSYSRTMYGCTAYWTNFFEYCEARGEEPDVILYLIPEYYGNVSDPQYSIHQWINEKYTVHVDRGIYRIYVRSVKE